MSGLQKCLRTKSISTEQSVNFYYSSFLSRKQNKSSGSATDNTANKQHHPSANVKSFAPLNKTDTFANKAQVTFSKNNVRQPTSAKAPDQQPTTSINETDTAGFSLSTLPSLRTTVQTIFNLFKRLFQFLNVMKVLTRIQQGVSTFSPDSELLTTLSTVVQILVSLIDDGTE